MDSTTQTIIEPNTGWRAIDWRELLDYRDLFVFLIWRTVKVRYAQSALGIGWAVIQPLFSMLVFTIIFGMLAKVESNGVPYAVFSLAALAPWTYFANALTEGAASLVQNANMVNKVYFPRLVLPLSAVLAKLVDFCIALVMLFGLMAWYGIVPTWGCMMLPALVLLMVLTAAGLGMWLTAFAIQYRDVNYAMNFIVQLAMYAAPVVYPASLVPDRFRLAYALNPMVGVIEGFRTALLGNEMVVDSVPVPGMPWDLLVVGTASATVIAITGCLYFRRKESIFADVA